MAKRQQTNYIDGAGVEYLVPIGLAPASQLLAWGNPGDGKVLQRSSSSVVGIDVYTEAEVDTFLVGKSDTGHTHNLGNLTDVLRAFKSSDQTGIGTSFVDVSNLGLTIASGESWSFEFKLLVTTSATTIGADLSVNGPTCTNVAWNIIKWASAVGARLDGSSTYDSVAAASTTGNGATLLLYSISGVLHNATAGGTLIPRIKAEASGTCDVLAGSCGFAWRTNP